MRRVPDQKDSGGQDMEVERKSDGPIYAEKFKKQWRINALEKEKEIDLQRFPAGRGQIYGKQGNIRELIIV